MGAGTHAVGSSSVSSQAHWQEAELEVEQRGLEPAPKMNVSSADGSFTTPCATAYVPCLLSHICVLALSLPLGISEVSPCEGNLEAYSH